MISYPIGVHFIESQGPTEQFQGIYRFCTKMEQKPEIRSNGDAFSILAINFPQCPRMFTCSFGSWRRSE
jgi:hypothetical protein